MPAIAQNKPIRIGLLTVKTGPLAQGGIQMEQGVNLFLKDRNNMLAGRKVELLVGDTGGNPAGTKTKAQELIERDNVDMIFGPLAAFELLAISDYVAAHKTPILSLAAAEDMSQRKPNPYFVRASGTSAQNMHVLADYAAKELKYKTVITVTEDFAYGYEQMGGFQRVFEGAGGHVVKKLWPPIVTPDYTPYIAQLSGVDAVVQGFAGSNPLKFMKQYKDAGVTLPVIGGGTAGDDALLKSFGDEAIGLVTASVFTSDLDTPVNKQFIAGMVRDTGAIPGLYAAGLYINGMVAEAALKATDGNTDDKDAFMKALRAVSLPDSPRGPFHFDHFGNVVGNVYIRRLEKQGRQAGADHDQDLSERQPVLDLRREVVPGAAGLFAGLSAAEGLNRSRSAARRESLADPVGQQRHAGRPAVPAVRRVLADLRADADPEPDARLDVHARRLFRREPHRRGRRILDRRTGCGAWRRAVRRNHRAVRAAPPGGRRTGAGAGDARAVLHGGRCLPDALGRRSDLGGDARSLRGATFAVRPGVPDLSARHHRRSPR